MIDVLVHGVVIDTVSNQLIADETKRCFQAIGWKSVATRLHRKPYVRKTEDEFQIHGDYGQGFEEVTCEVTWGQAKDTIKTYRENEPGIKFKIVTKRVPKS